MKNLLVIGTLLLFGCSKTPEENSSKTTNDRETTASTTDSAKVKNQFLDEIHLFSNEIDSLIDSTYGDNLLILAYYTQYDGVCSIILSSVPGFGGENQEYLTSRKLNNKTVNIYIDKSIKDNCIERLPIFYDELEKTDKEEYVPSLGNPWMRIYTFESPEEYQLIVKGGALDVFVEEE